MTWFPTCSTRQSRSQAPLCHYTRRLVSNQAEGTIARLRYSLGGDRPSQTAHIALFLARIHGIEVRFLTTQGWYFKVDSTRTSVRASQSPTYPTHELLETNTMLQ